MASASPEYLRVLELARSTSGGIESVALDLPTAWARDHGRVEVELTCGNDDLGWRARLVGEPQDVRRLELGVLQVDGTEVRWARVERRAYDGAWRRAIARFR